MLCCDWLRLIFPTKILAIVPRIRICWEKTKEFKSFLMLEKQPANCVHTIVTRESVRILSTQVLFTEKCTGMNARSQSCNGLSPQCYIEWETNILFPKSQKIMINSNNGPGHVWHERRRFPFTEFSYSL